jgi:putative dimethyl sulfoxide reductase chaperone
MDRQIQENLAHMYRFYATLLRDELTLEEVQFLMSPRFLEYFKWTYELAGEPAHREAAGRFMAYLRLHKPEELQSMLRYEYADLFLNAGPNPVFPYESVHISKTPVVQQQSIFALRELVRGMGVHIDPGFKDLDDHVAVELEVCALLLNQEKPELYESFFSGTIVKWLPDFCDQLNSCSQTPFYRELANLCSAFIQYCTTMMEQPPVSGQNQPETFCSRFAQTLRRR